MFKRLRNFYVNFLVPVTLLMTIFIFLSLLVTIPSLLIAEYSEKRDKQIANLCQPISLGDNYTIENTEVVIGTGHVVGYTVGVKGIRRQHVYEETMIFVHGTPVSDYHGYRIIKDNHLKEYLCSPQAIETIY